MNGNPKEELMAILSKFGDVYGDGEIVEAVDIRFRVGKHFISGGVVGKTQFLIPLYDWPNMKRKVEKTLAKDDDKPF